MGMGMGIGMGIMLRSKSGNSLAGCMASMEVV